MRVGANTSGADQGSWRVSPGLWARYESYLLSIASLASLSITSSQWMSVSLGRRWDFELAVSSGTHRP
jgi:hypothetical protein